MTDAQTAQQIRSWLEAPRGVFSWPTDPCGYDQHIRFVQHRNENFKGGGIKEFRKFASDYADSLDKPH